MKIKAFTLAEVMVTLAVVGILGAILIPTLSKQAPNQRIVLFKKAYSSLEKTVGELVNDEIHYPSTELVTINLMSTPASFNYLTTSNDITAGDDKFCYLLADSMNTVGTVDCADSKKNYTFQTTDGIVWKIIYTSALKFPASSTFDANTARILMDVNGLQDPNCGHLSTTDKSATCQNNTISDQYEVQLRYDGKIKLISEDGQAILINPTENRRIQ